MKKFAGNLLVFLSIIILFNLIYLLLLVKTDWTCIKRAESIAFDNPHYDYLVIGNSLALDAFDAGYLASEGYKTYNLALGGASLRTAYIQLGEYLESYPHKPKMVLLGMASYLGSFDDASIHPVVELTRKDHRYSLADLPLYSLRWLGTEMLKKLVSSKHRQAKLVEGQLRFGKKVPDVSSYSEKEFRCSKYGNSSYVKQIASLCQQYKTQLIVVEMPGFRNTRNRSPVGPYSISLLPGTSTKLFNFNAVDFADCFDDKNDWIGNSHLNEFGARKFTRNVIEFILSRPENSGSSANCL